MGINRRQFSGLTSAGLATAMLPGGTWAVETGGIPRTEHDKLVGGSPHKLDPHPAWNRDYTKMCLNGAPDGHRQVFVADLESVIG